MENKWTTKETELTTKNIKRPKLSKEKNQVKNILSYSTHKQKGDKKNIKFETQNKITRQLKK